MQSVEASMQTIKSRCFMLAGHVFRRVGRTHRDLATSAETVTYPFHHRESYRDEEDGNDRRRQHAADNDCAQYLTRDSTCSRGHPQRYAAQDECECGHNDGTEAYSGRTECGIIDALPACVFRSCELDDQNGVFGGKADEHDQPDLREDIVLEAAKIESQVSPHDGHWCAQQNAEWQTPALILRGK